VEGGGPEALEGETLIRGCCYCCCSFCATRTDEKTEVRVSNGRLFVCDKCMPTFRRLDSDQSNRLPFVRSAGPSARSVSMPGDWSSNPVVFTTMPADNRQRGDR